MYSNTLFTVMNFNNSSNNNKVGLEMYVVRKLFLLNSAQNCLVSCQISFNSDYANGRR
jgi:hypothetical protein